MDSILERIDTMNITDPDTSHPAQLTPSLPSSLRPFDPSTDGSRQGGATRLRRKSSHVERWVDEQRRLSIADQSDETPVYAGDVQAVGTKSHPYLAYPNLGVGEISKQDRDDLATLHSFVLVDDCAPAPSAFRDTGGSATATPRPSPPSTPRKTSPFRQTQGIFGSASPLRNFHLAFGTRRSSTSSGVSGSHISSHVQPPGSPTPRRSADTSSSYSRPYTLSTRYTSGRHDSTLAPALESFQPKALPVWKFKRPTAVGPTRVPSETSTNMIPPRPSLSSSVTRSSAASVTHSSIDAPSVSRRLNFGSVQPHSPAAFSSSPSLWSLPTDASHMYDPPDSTKVIARDRERANTIRIPLSLKNGTPNGRGLNVITGPLGSPKTRKKRKLVIGGIPEDDERRFHAARKWCEGFGELSQMTRVSNGDVHVEFKRAEVAETVCRLQARVYIAGVGSVCLSYFTGKRP